MNFIPICALLFLLGACSMLPYEERFSCRLKNNYGKCISIQEAYDGEYSDVDDWDLVPGEEIDKEEKVGKNKKRVNGKTANLVQPSSEDMYVDELYGELSQLIRQPITPIIKAPKEMRTLVLTYSSSGDKKTLYMPRYIYTILEDAEFVVRQYFNTPEHDAQVINPMGDQ